MKTWIVFFLTNLWLTIAKSQTIGDLFVQLPQRTFIPLQKMVGVSFTTAMRKSLITQKTHQAIRNFRQDNVHAYLTFATETDGDGYSFEMTYWKLPDGNKLIVSTVNNNGNCSQFTEQVDFWLYKQGQLSNVSNQYRPPLTLSKFYKKSSATLSKLQKSGINYGLWKLPQVGTTIWVEPPQYDCDTDAMPLGDYYFLLVWQGNSFQMLRKEMANR
ncbi:MAG: hypothetical protein U0Y10_06960 [Spirosomataceae bacterium]